MAVDAAAPAVQEQGKPEAPLLFFFFPAAFEEGFALQQAAICAVLQDGNEQEDQEDNATDKEPELFLL